MQKAHDAAKSKWRLFKGGEQTRRQNDEKDVGVGTTRDSLVWMTDEKGKANAENLSGFEHSLSQKSRRTGKRNRRKHSYIRKRRKNEMCRETESRKQ